MNTQPRTPSAKMAYLIEAIREHAVRHYESGGWDLVVETMDDAEIIEHLRHDMWTKKQAINIIASHIAIHDEYRAEIQSTAF